jgi:type II secretory pathway pseudopilin PulG
MAANPVVRKRSRLRRDDGFTLVELLVAMMMLNVAILALVAVFASSALSLHRSAERGTAVTLAESQLEVYRTVAFTSIRVDSSLIPASGNYVTAHTADSTIPLATGQAVGGSNGDAACPDDAFPASCYPVQTVTGPDGRPYEVDTYVTYVNNDATLSVRTPASDLNLKRVTVVVRDGTTGDVQAQQSSAFQRI